MSESFEEVGLETPVLTAEEQPVLRAKTSDEGSECEQAQIQRFVEAKRSDECTSVERTKNGRLVNAKRSDLLKRADAAPEDLLARKIGRIERQGCGPRGVYQEGLLTLQKLRTGGKQTVVVQHVQVSEGGQAVIAGSVKCREGA